MATFGPVQHMSSQFEADDFANYWLKGFIQGTPTPLSMATDATGDTLLSRAEINSQGFIKTAGGVIFVPYFSAAYDLWLFPTAAEADANDTTNATQVADDEQPAGLAISGDYAALTTTVSILTTDLTLTTNLRTQGYHVAGDKGGAEFLSTGVNTPGSAGTTDWDNLFIYDLVGNQFQYIDSRIEIRKLGAKTDGTNNAAIILSALAAATPSATATFTAVDGSTVYLGSGKFTFEGNIPVPEWVNILGEGKGISALVCGNSSATLTVGVSGTANRGGMSGRFTVDGASTSTKVMSIGSAVERTFIDMDVVNGAEDGCLIESAQNCVFINFGCQHNGSGGVGSGLVLDLGAGNNHFFGAEMNRNAQNNVRIRQSGASPSGAFDVPTNNNFYGGVIERFEDEATFNAGIFQGNGRNNRFIGTDLSITGVTATANLPMVRHERIDATKQSTNIIFDSCTWSGSASFTTLYDGQGNGNAINAQFTGHNTFENFAKVFRLDDDCTIDYHGATDSSGGTFFTALGSKSQADLIRFSLANALLSLIGSAAGSDELYLSVAGEANPRFIMRPNGISAGPGSGVVDVSLARETAASLPAWAMSVPMKISGTNIVDYAGSGVPSIAYADGSTYRRSDGGGALDNFYVRVSGAWVGKA